MALGGFDVVLIDVRVVLIGVEWFWCGFDVDFECDFDNLDAYFERTSV